MCLLYKYEGWSKWSPSTSKIPHSSSLYALPSRGFLNFLMEEPLFAAQMLPVTTRRESIGKSLRKKKKNGEGAPQPAHCPPLKNLRKLGGN